MANTITRRSADLPIEIEKGSTFRHKLTWKSGPAGTETPVDLTGATGRIQIRNTVTSSNKLFELSSVIDDPAIIDEYTNNEVGITFGTPDPADGTINLYISHHNTAKFNWKKGAYSLEVELANGDVRTLVRGSISAYDEVTR